ncbi:ATP synthase F1 subunit epsilon [Anaerorhabdus furcosa]|uniref:ATP synthase epsilon chain n=1 Tax=Anaerorhabdus furcosa TaxID=118967 RepID=A0A1T4KAI2_9FIRM|nr:ATP synthase F1 subunit epsilon [Anaerorhabdus furcosa]SJZ39421.1 F-type H+-transporting ATPase subunit epsilon [Anaerorhabdus furcosa]
MILCKIVTPFGKYKELETPILNVRNSVGEMGILPNRVPIVTMLEISKMTTVENGEREEYAIGGGLLYFKENEAMILVDSIENKKEIEKERALAAKARAESLLNSKDESVDIKRAELSLKRAMNRLKVVGE